MSDPIVKMLSITKTFPGGVEANKNANLEVVAGEIHAIVGENGAGKSTLMNILYGLHHPDSGEIFVGGNKIELDNPRTAKAIGISMVHQHFMLVPSFTALQNVILGYEPRKGKVLVANKQASKQVGELCERYNLDLPLDTPVRDLPVGLQQRVEIIKALYRGAKILILDEPTAVLTPLEVKDFFRICREMANRGTTILFISHKLREVLSLSDRITVMRKGETVATVKASETNENQLANLIVGRDRIWTLSKKEAAVEADAMLKADNLFVRNKRGGIGIRGLSLSVRAGEILGLAGVEGNGQSELAAGLAGLLPTESGKIILNKNEITNCSVEQRRAMGLRYIPEDRSTEGLSLDSSIAENLIIDQNDRSEFLRKGGIIDWEQVKAHAEEKIKEFNVVAPNAGVNAANLSGGNQQKVLAAREISGKQRCLVVAHPTRGLDIGAAEFIYKRLFDVRDNGGAVLLISADLDEIFLLSDRIVVLYEGQIAGEFLPDQATPEQVGLYMTGASNSSGSKYVEE